jgi:hypothetical protein
LPKLTQLPQTIVSDTIRPSIFEVLIMLHAEFGQDFSNNFEAAYSAALDSLEKNTASNETDLGQLIENLRVAHDELIKGGEFVRQGTDDQWRATTVITQGLLEQAMAKTISSNFQVDATILTPRMPSPLMQSETVDLTAINVAQAVDFAKFRNGVLKEFLSASGVLKAVYSHDATTILATKEQAGLATYAANLEKFPTLKNQPIIKIDMSNFPAEITGATYNINGCAVSVESKQITQVDAKNKDWAIRVGDKAKSRVDQVKSFIVQNTVACIG